VPTAFSRREAPASFASDPSPHLLHLFSPQHPGLFTPEPCWLCRPKQPRRIRSLPADTEPLLLPNRVMTVSPLGALIGNGQLALTPVCQFQHLSPSRRMLCFEAFVTSISHSDIYNLSLRLLLNVRVLAPTGAVDTIPLFKKEIFCSSSCLVCKSTRYRRQ
jgi:hypothetical protein